VVGLPRTSPLHRTRRQRFGFIPGIFGAESVSLNVSQVTTMPKTLRLCSWLLPALGLGMTGYFYLAAIFNDLAWFFVVIWTFFAYVLFSLAIPAAYSCTRRTVVLVALLFSVCFAFTTYFDVRFVRFTTLDFSPIEVPFVQSLVAASTWIAVRRKSRQEAQNA